ncbi:hypothetical protein GGI02_001480 [Coemansia sp. RSA 2322]|uniref:PH domain-containing protein n=1 Tax=Coemansia thaxteri TaxID=2663907 RepID=A0A9W8BD95_9FUNG|nr:hypothetical protein H4R26_002238 [Coemansia thaxteri]KAJ2472585.1 hypothetical protein GGI02_001480 [Coemansia sp. RSA 2322]
MPVIGGSKTFASLLHLSSSTKADSRAAFSPYTGSLSSTARDYSRPGHTDNDGTPAFAAAIGMGTCITLNVRYVAKDMWRKVTFPPGITVTQARDICMLRFSIWQQTMYSEGGADGAGADGSAGSEYQRPSIDQRSEEVGSLNFQSRGGKTGATAGLDGIAGGGGGGGNGGSQNALAQFRDQYGLFWTSSGHWLEADEMLSSYPLRKGEVLELQHVIDFVPLQPDEFRYSYAEGHIYCLHADSATTSSWRLRWAVLRRLVLRLYKQKGQQDADVVIDLSKPFNLTDQGGRSWPRNPAKMNDIVAVLNTLDIPAVSLNPEALPGRHVTGDGGILVLQPMAGGGNSSAQARSGGHRAFVFCASSASEYEVWQHTLRQTQMASVNGDGEARAGGGHAVSGSSGQGTPHIVQSPDPTASCATLRGSSNNILSRSSLNEAPTTPGGHTGLASSSNSKPYVVGQTMSSALSPKLNQRPRAPTSSTRHEGYVNRKASDGYGFRRRYCVLTPSTLFGFLHANDSKDCAESTQLLEKCEFAIALDPSLVTIEAIAWNGRYLLRVFGPDSQCLRDKPRATSIQPEENARFHCTDILATAAQAAIEQYGSTFGMLPDSRELVRLMIEDHDEGQLWAVGFNSIAGLQITSQSKVIISARRAAALTESKSHAEFKPACSRSPEDSYHSRAPQDECDASTSSTAPSSPGAGRQQSLSEFIVSQMDPITGQPLQKVAPAAPPVRCAEAHRQAPTSPLACASETSRADKHHSTHAGPKWIPLSIDKYIKEDEERRRHHELTAHNSISRPPHTASSTGSSSNRVLGSQASNISDSDHHFQSQHSGHSHTSEARPPARFNWFKRRGSTSK